MAATLFAESFADVNILGRTLLDEAYDQGATVLKVANNAGFAVGDPIYVGTPSTETCEKAVVQALTGSTGITVATGLKLPHASFESVIKVLGSSIHIYRAPNVDNTAPDDTFFLPIAVRDIAADQTSTYYRDPDGSSAFWYKMTYYNESANIETALADSVAVRGDDFGHYASLTEIRSEAGFDKAYNLKDTVIDQQRRAAEAEINASLGSAYTVPFVKPIPPIINTLTIQLAAAMLKAHAYGRSAAKDALADARKAITLYASRDGTIAGEDGISLATGGGVSSYPDEEAPRAFEIGMRF